MAKRPDGNPAITEEPRPDAQEGEFSAAEIERYERLFARQAAKKLKDDRIAAGLRWRHVVLKYVGAVPHPYPAIMCTAQDVSILEHLRCDGRHEFIERSVPVHLGDYVEQWSGHHANLPDFLEMEVEW